MFLSLRDFYTLFVLYSCCAFIMDALNIHTYHKGSASALPLFRLSEHSVKCLFIPIYHISQGQLQAAQLK